MTTAAPARGLAALSEDDLAAMYDSGEPGAMAAAVAELARRDTAKARADRARARRKAIAGDWESEAYAQYLRADQYARGNLLSREGQAKGLNPWPRLWMGSEETARRNSSEELRTFWDHVEARPVTVTEYRAQSRRPEERPWEGQDMTETTTAPVSTPEQRRAARAAAIAEANERLTAPVAAPAGLAAGAAVAVPAAARVTQAATVPALAVTPVDGARVLDQAYGWLGHMAVWPSPAAQITATLYAAASHAVDEKTGMPVFSYAPRLFVTGASPEGGDGKSWMARLTAALCPKPERLAEMSKASLIDLIDQRCTVVITELDALVGTGTRNQWLPTIVKLGYEFDGATSRKNGGQVQKIPLCGWVILDGTDFVIHSTGGRLRTLLSRCIIVYAARAPEGYRPPRYDREARATAAAIGRRLGRFGAQAVKDGLADLVPGVPAHLGNRPFTLWEPLFAVAEAAGGDWPLLARYACEYVETAGGQAQQDAADDAAVSRALDAWDAPAPSWQELDS